MSNAIICPAPMVWCVCVWVSVYMCICAYTQKQMHWNSIDDRGRLMTAGSDPTHKPWVRKHQKLLH
jgi:hypothetical protein